MRYRVIVTGPNYGWSVSYWNDTNPADALRQRLSVNDPPVGCDNGTAKVVAIEKDVTNNSFLDVGRPSFFKWHRISEIRVALTNDKRVTENRTLSKM